MTASTIVLITLVLYKTLLIAIGLWASARNRTTTDFFLGGRNLGPLVAGLSYAASTSSAWVLLGFSGFVYTIGLSAIWMVPGIWAGYAVVWLYFGPQLQQQSAQHQQITLTDFLLQDSPPTSTRKTAATIAASMIVFCFVFYIAAQFDAAGKAFAEHFALSVPQAVVVGAVIVVVYSLVGGFWAVSVTDTLQAVIMMLVAVVLPTAALVAAGGFSQTLDTLSAQLPDSYLNIQGGYSPLVFVGFVLGTIGTSLGALGQPHLMSRLMAIRGNRERIQGFTIAIVWGITVLIGMVILGLCGRALMPALDNGETLFYQIAIAYLPPVLGGIVVAATLSAVMSTVDSILLAAAGAVAHDMRVTARFPDHPLLTSRLVMLLIGLVAVVLTLTLPDTIFNRVLFAWSALGAAFGPIIWWRVRGRQVSANVALASMLSGFITTVLFYALGAVPPNNTLLSQAAHLPGDPFERVVPWLPALLILRFSPTAPIAALSRS